MLHILSNVIFHADFSAGVDADFDVALVAADVLYLKLDRSVMIFRLDLDCVRPHDAKLYWIHELWRDLLGVLPAGNKLIELDLS